MDDPAAQAPAAQQGMRLAVRHAGTGASGRNRPWSLRSAHSAAGIGCVKVSTLRACWAGDEAPGMTDATAG